MKLQTRRPAVEQLSGVVYVFRLACPTRVTTALENKHETNPSV